MEKIDIEELQYQLEKAHDLLQIFDEFLDECPTGKREDFDERIRNDVSFEVELSCFVARLNTFRSLLLTASEIIFNQYKKELKV